MLVRGRLTGRTPKVGCGVWRVLDRALSRLNQWTERAVVLGVGLMTVLVLLQVVLRYVFKTGLPWTEELSRYLMLFIAFVGASIGVRRERHVATQFLVQWLPPPLRKAVQLFSDLVVLVFLLLLMNASWQMITRFYLQRSPAMRISMAWPQATVLLGAVLMAIQLVGVIVRRINTPAGTSQPKDTPGMTERPDGAAGAPGTGSR